MAEDEFEEETYSIILSSLKHPLRRRILRMLAIKSLSFSEILAELAIDSGHLNYHIKSLGEIVAQNDDGKYSLSKIGQAAVELMSGVEEQHYSAKKLKHAKRLNSTVIIFSTLFVIALVIWTLYAFAYTTQEQTTLFETRFDAEKILINLQPDQTFNYTINLITANNNEGEGFTIGKNSTVVFVVPFANSASEWTRHFSDTLLELNGRRGAFDLSTTVYGVDGQILRQFSYTGDLRVYTRTLNFEFKEAGEYRIEILNLGGEFSGALVPNGNQVTYQKPLYYYGVAGVIILLLYPILLILNRKMLKTNAKSFSY